MIPGEYQLAEGDIIANVGRKTVTIEVTNSGDATNPSRFPLPFLRNQ